MEKNQKSKKSPAVMWDFLTEAVEKRQNLGETVGTTNVKQPGFHFSQKIEKFRHKFLKKWTPQLSKIPSS